MTLAALRATGERDRNLLSSPYRALIASQPSFPRPNLYLGHVAAARGLQLAWASDAKRSCCARAGSGWLAQRVPIRLRPASGFTWSAPGPPPCWSRRHRGRTCGVRHRWPGLGELVAGSCLSTTNGCDDRVARPCDRRGLLEWLLCHGTGCPACSVIRRDFDNHHLQSAPSTRRRQRLQLRRQSGNADDPAAARAHR